jgi:methionine--tRNA ligase beta chain
MGVSFEDFKKLEIRIGRIVKAQVVEGSEKLLKLEVDFDPSTGSGSSKRQIISGIAKFYEPSDLIGKQCPFIVNLEPRKIMGLESQGMILAVGVDDKAVLIHPDKEVPEGSEIR